ncbi:Hypothetical protein ETEE_3755 [Edwardsiella anguillarum ET080813]|uniref:Uncharacterized protein n=1 Tax=Edwardsiella anguillarum ET080813 TaxID=667120 RepID=A0A076LTZ5_9GAMM|nr:Hypothetical protein ETEE_3755 [Edwardsiella anguillarum ET080813]
MKREFSSVNRNSPRLGKGIDHLNDEGILNEAIGKAVY